MDNINNHQNVISLENGKPLEEAEVVAKATRTQISESRYTLSNGLVARVIELPEDADTSNLLPSDLELIDLVDHNYEFLDSLSKLCTRVENPAKILELIHCKVRTAKRDQEKIIDGSTPSESKLMRVKSLERTVTKAAAEIAGIIHDSTEEGHVIPRGWDKVFRTLSSAITPNQPIAKNVLGDMK